MTSSACSAAPVLVAEHGVAGGGVERVLGAVEHEVMLTVGGDRESAEHVRAAR